MRGLAPLVLVASTVALGCDATTGVRLTIYGGSLVADQVSITAASARSTITHLLPANAGPPLVWPVSLIASFPADVAQVSFQVLALHGGVEVAHRDSPEVALRAHAVVDVDLSLDGDRLDDSGAPADLPPVEKDYVQAVLADAPLGYYHLGEADGTLAADATGRMQAGSYGAGVQRHQASLLSNAGPLADGASGFPGGAATAAETVRCTPTTATALLPDLALSVELWFSQPAGNTEGAVLLSYDYASSSKLVPVYSLSLASNRLSFYVHTGQRLDQSTLLGATTLAPNHAYHVVATYDGTKGEMRLWLDGVSDGISTSNSGVIGHGNASSGLGIGGTRNDLAVPGFHGTLDEVAVYGTVLPEARVIAHFRSGTTP